MMQLKIEIFLIILFHSFKFVDPIEIFLDCNKTVFLGRVHHPLSRGTSFISALIYFPFEKWL